MMKKILVAAISVYQKLLSPLVPPTCRYYPTCSNYAKEAIIKYGNVRGSWKALLRILRCNPFFKGGYDPVVKSKKRC
ncbi:MAG: membrane protein insertion efficiency factor YidD [Actinomycetia bacterium]|nr:membrane protein insertion efficiency factor YidD [Actinomycetes bacterium]